MTTPDATCFHLVENCSIQISVGPFAIDSLIRTTLESQSDPVALKDPQEDHSKWNPPSCLNLCLILISITAPPSHLLSPSRSVQLLLSPLASIPIQLLSSLSRSSIPPLLVSCPDAWIQTLLFESYCARVQEIKLSEVRSC
jgi:hypothetical protein